MNPIEDEPERDAARLGAITRLFELAARTLHSAGHSHGLYPAQWTALRYLASAAPGQRTSSALARFQQMAIGPVTRSVRVLIEKGLVVKGGSAGHHRSERLDLTPRGRALLDEDPLLAVDANLKRLAPDDLFLLSSVLGRIIATLHPRDEEAGAPGLEAAFDDADDVRR
jgi:DNA-binding MarR family transcriptional regulator